MKIQLPKIRQFEKLTGSITIPDMVSGRAFSALWSEITNSTEDNPHQKRWRAAYTLISGWGSFDIGGMASAEITADGDNVPIQLMVWVGNQVDAHLSELTDPKKLLTESPNG